MGGTLFPLIMGIVNVTRDSFYEGNRFGTEAAIAHGMRLYQEGADLIDIGGESSRPGASPVSQEDELARVLPVIRSLHSNIPIPLSIDTMKPAVAKAAIDAGATIINDISGFRDRHMVEVAAKTGAKVCVMHMQGTPQTMQSNPYYAEGVVDALLDWFKQKIADLLHEGIEKTKIILDPGIGFGKTVDDNYQILQNLHKFRALGFPLLVGVSRKSFMGKVLGKPPTELLAATLAMNTIVIFSSVDIIRVHDVREHRDCATVIQKYLNTAQAITR